MGVLQTVVCLLDLAMTPFACEPVLFIGLIHRTMTSV